MRYIIGFLIGATLGCIIVFLSTLWRSKWSPPMVLALLLLPFPALAQAPDTLKLTCRWDLLRVRGDTVIVARVCGTLDWWAWRRLHPDSAYARLIPGKVKGVDSLDVLLP